MCKKVLLYTECKHHDNEFLHDGHKKIMLKLICSSFSEPGWQWKTWQEAEIHPRQDAIRLKKQTHTPIYALIGRETHERVNIDVNFSSSFCF